MNDLIDSFKDWFGDDYKIPCGSRAIPLAEISIGKVSAIELAQWMTENGFAVKKTPEDFISLVNKLKEELSLK